jgi:hypothetical protein
MNLVLSKELAVNGCGPVLVHAVDARRGSVEANRLLRDRVVAMEWVNAKRSPMLCLRMIVSTSLAYLV